MINRKDFKNHFFLLKYFKTDISMKTQQHFFVLNHQKTITKPCMDNISSCLEKVKNVVRWRFCFLKQVIHKLVNYTKLLLNQKIDVKIFHRILIMMSVYVIRLSLQPYSKNQCWQILICGYIFVISPNILPHLLLTNHL